MEEQFKHIDLYEAYQQGTLSDKGLLDFEARLSYDSEFAKEFKSYQNLEAGIKQHFRDELKNKLTQIDAELENVEEPKSTGKLRKLYWVTSSIAASLLIGFLLFNYFNSESKYQQLVEQNWPYEEGLPVTMAEKGIYDEAMNAFKQEQWQKAEGLLLKINSDTANYFLGIINYQQIDYHNSIEYFQKIPNNSFWHQESEFRLALAYLSNKKIEKAKEILSFISTTNSSIYKAEAKQLLGQL